RHGLAVAADNVLVCAGAQHALLTVLASLFNPGDRIAAEQLSYPLLKQLARRLRLNLTPIRMDQSGMLPDALEAACRIGAVKGLYLMPTCQNPTLAQIPEYRRHELVAICRQYDIMIIEDDVYALSLAHSLPPLATLAPERCCFIASTSEALSGGLRIAYLCAPEASYHELERTISYTISMAPPLMAELATMWLRDGTADRVLGAKREEAAARNALARRLLDGFRLETRTTGFFCWLRLPDPWSAATFAEAARKRGIIVADSAHFALSHAALEQGVRLALGGVRTREALTCALGVLAELLGGGGGR
ncbi:MAG: PLP-dependent aminotransferase family protein, partial [Bilophila sp.]